MEKRKVACRLLVAKRKVKRQFGTPSHRWEDNIELNLIETTSEGTDWIHQAQDRVSGSLVGTR
jgi:hypothetical protein